MYFSRCSVVACGFIERQVPLTTCTIIRMEACEREKTSIRPIHWLKLSPRPPQFHRRGQAQEAALLQLRPQSRRDSAGGLDLFRPHLAGALHPGGYLRQQLGVGARVHRAAAPIQAGYLLYRHLFLILICVTGLRGGYVVAPGGDTPAPVCGVSSAARSRSTNFCTLPTALRGISASSSSRSGQ